MPITIKLEIEKSTRSKEPFDADITYTGNGKSRVSLALWKPSIMEAVRVAMEPILVIAPNATQEEIDKHYERYP